MRPWDSLFAGLGKNRGNFWLCGNSRESGFKPRELDGEPDLESAKGDPIGCGVYFTVNELGDMRNASGNLRHAQNVTRPLACFADFDEGTEEEQFAKIMDSPLTPSAIVKSGRGYHLYWFLDGATKADLPLWTATQKNIARFFGSDEAISDPARLMRLPGSWHTKGEHKTVDLTNIDPENRRSLAEIVAAFPDEVKPTAVGEWKGLLTRLTKEGGRDVGATRVVGGLMSRFDPVDWPTVVWPIMLYWNNTMTDKPLKESEIRRSYESIAKKELAKRKAQGDGLPMWDEGDMEPVVEKDGETLKVGIRVAEGTAVFAFSDFEQANSRDLDANLSVTFEMPGSHPKPFTSHLNLLSLSTRTNFARELQALGKSVEWRLLLSTACEAAIKHKASEDTSVDLNDVDDVETVSLFHPFITEGSANLLFGDGGTGKTYLCLRLAISLALGLDFVGYVPRRTCPTLFVDYEDTEFEAKKRIRELGRALGVVGPDIEETLSKIRYFNPGGAPLHTVVPAIRKIVDKYGVGLILVDSVTTACGGEPEKAESASRFYNALKKIGVTSLSIAHVAKSNAGEADQNYAFGSIFWHNLARNTWNVQGEEELSVDELQDLLGEKARQLGMFHKKCNNGPKHKPIPIRIVYNRGDRTVRIEEGKSGFWERNMKVGERVLRLLRNGPQTKSQLQDNLGEDVKSEALKKSLYRLKEQGLVVQESEVSGGKYSLKKT